MHFFVADAADYAPYQLEVHRIGLDLGGYRKAFDAHEKFVEWFVGALGDHAEFFAVGEDAPSGAEESLYGVEHLVSGFLGFFVDVEEVRHRTKHVQRHHCAEGRHLDSR